MSRQATGLRFRPPPSGETSPEVAWLLRAALGSHPGPAPEGRDEVIWRLAGRLGVQARIGSRSAPAAGELSADLAARFAEARRRATATAMLYEAIALELARLAVRRGAPLVFLKGYALVAAGWVAPGSRSFADLDVLAPRAAAEALRADLLERGYRSWPVPANDQHLAPLEAPRGGALDLHFRLRGVQIGEQGWASAEELIRSGRWRRLEELPGDCRVPDRGLTAAHLLAHGVEQHGLKPHTYPLLRMVADLVDLMPDDEAWERFGRQDFPLVRQAVSTQELEAVRGLATDLLADRLPASGAPALLLAHLLAGASDPPYLRSLRRRQLWARLREARRGGRLLGYLARKLAERSGRGDGSGAPLRLR